MRRAIFCFFIVMVVSPGIALSADKVQLELAKFWLEEMRQNPTLHQQAIWNIEKARETGVDLKEIGTSEQELKVLKGKGCRTNAILNIRALKRRQLPEDENTCFLLFMEELASCRLHLDQVLPDFREFGSFQKMVKTKKLIEKNAENEDQAKEWRSWLLIYQN